jgi:hypothetical protein
MDILIHIAGWAGMILIVLAYYLVSNKKLIPTGRLYQWMNLIGSASIGVHVLYQRAWAAVALEIVWALIAVVALLKIRE